MSPSLSPILAAGLRVLYGRAMIGHWRHVRRRGYHHGNLRDALVEAARALIAERGAGGFTLAEAAKLAGVSAAAPYRHFNDRGALIAELARRGFEEFGARLAAAWDGGRPEPTTALGRVGASYLDFAGAQPGLYKAMFGNVRNSRDAAVPPEAKAAFEGIREVAATVLRAAGAPRADATRIALQIWATAHGVATLSAGGHLLDAHCRGEPIDVLSESVAAILEKAVRDSAASSAGQTR
jgi:AcrR family transcriptional regulator